MADRAIENLPKNSRRARQAWNGRLRSIEIGKYILQERRHSETRIALNIARLRLRARSQGYRV